MPSPFPGMDPYLESPRLWPDVHHSLISGIRQQLTPQLRPKYIARIEERVYISDDTDPGREVIIPIIPDVHLTVADGDARPASPHRGGASQGSANVARAIEVVELINQEIHEARIEIRDLVRREVVTVIEVLSPTNKLRGSEGRRLYMEKRRALVKSPAHLVEIDLLRTGAPVFVGHPLPPHDYGVYVSRATGDGRRGLFWPITLDQQLPPLRIPLRDGDPDAELDLQRALNEAYEQAGYETDLDYAEQPDVNLPPQAAAWADEMLRAKGLR
jgi:hypothetical protein